MSVPFSALQRAVERMSLGRVSMVRVEGKDQFAVYSTEGGTYYSRIIDGMALAISQEPGEIIGRAVQSVLGDLDGRRSEPPLVVEDPPPPPFAEPEPAAPESTIWEAIAALPGSGAFTVEYRLDPDAYTVTHKATGRSIDVTRRLLTELEGDDAEAQARRLLSLAVMGLLLQQQQAA